jgi:hypothetical protein
MQTTAELQTARQTARFRQRELTGHDRVQTNHRYRSREIVVSTSLRIRWDGSSGRAPSPQNRSSEPFVEAGLPESTKEEGSKPNTRGSQPRQTRQATSRRVPEAPADQRHQASAGAAGTKPNLLHATAWEQKQTGPRAPAFQPKAPQGQVLHKGAYT